MSCSSCCGGACGIRSGSGWSCWRTYKVICRNVNVIDLYVAVDADGVADVAQDGPQLIYYCSI